MMFDKITRTSTNSTSTTKRAVRRSIVAAPAELLRTHIPAGAVRLTDSAGSRVLYYATSKIRELTVEALKSLEPGLSLADLSADELKTLVQWAGVDTEARTKSGLKRAIQRHFE